jgi:hypothetical protein
MGEVLKFKSRRTEPYGVKQVLKDAKRQGLSDILVIGWYNDGSGNVFIGASDTTRASLVFMLEDAKHKIMYED